MAACDDFGVDTHLSMAEVVFQGVQDTGVHFSGFGIDMGGLAPPGDLRDLQNHAADPEAFAGPVHFRPGVQAFDQEIHAKTHRVECLAERVFQGAVGVHVEQGHRSLGGVEIRDIPRFNQLRGGAFIQSQMFGDTMCDGVAVFRRAQIAPLFKTIRPRDMQGLLGFVEPGFEPRQFVFTHQYQKVGFAMPVRIADRIAPGPRQSPTPVEGQALSRCKFGG